MVGGLFCQETGASIAVMLFPAVGPLTLSVVAGRRWMNLLWAVLAFLGVLLLGGSSTHLDPLGVAFTLVAATFWAGYILLSKATGRHFAGIQGLAVAMVAGSVVTVPIALATTGRRLFEPHVLIAGLGIALLSSVAPYALEMTALRRTPAATFAIIVALAPAVAAAAGFFILGQKLTTHDVFGIVAVICASIGAVCTPPGKPERQKDG